MWWECLKMRFSCLHHLWSLLLDLDVWSCSFHSSVSLAALWTRWHDNSPSLILLCPFFWTSVHLRLCSALKLRLIQSPVSELYFSSHLRWFIEPQLLQQQNGNNNLSIYKSLSWIRVLNVLKMFSQLVISTIIILNMKSEKSKKKLID